LVFNEAVRDRAPVEASAFPARRDREARVLTSLMVAAAALAAGPFALSLVDRVRRRALRGRPVRR
jgi:hypothetical protein